MDEKNNEKEGEIDYKWQYKIIAMRYEDVLGMIDELKAKDRQLSARISRLTSMVRRELYDEDEGEEGLGEEREKEAIVSVQRIPVKPGDSVRHYFENRTT